MWQSMQPTSFSGVWAPSLPIERRLSSTSAMISFLYARASSAGSCRIASRLACTLFSHDFTQPCVTPVWHSTHCARVASMSTSGGL